MQTLVSITSCSTLLVLTGKERPGLELITVKLQLLLHINYRILILNEQTAVSSTKNENQTERLNEGQFFWEMTQWVDWQENSQK